MKKILLCCAICIATLTNASAQSDNSQKPERQRMNRTEMAAQRTKQMVEKYNLNESQAQKLKELNEKTWSSPMGQRRGGGHNRPDSTATPRRQRPATDGNTSASAQQPQQRPQQHRPMNSNGFKERMEQYNKALKAIMTEEQYKAYEADMQKRRAK